jgi:predicted dehydrogenase
MNATRDSKGQPVVAALAGLGNHGLTIQNAVAESGLYNIVAVYDPDEREAGASSKRFDCVAADSFEGLIATPGLEAVVLVSPNHLHRAQCEAAFAAGLHVFVEKPIANFVTDGVAIVQAAQQSGRLLMVGHHMRRTASARLGEQLIREGKLGEVAAVEIHFSADNTRRMPPDAWRLRPDMCPLLPMMQLGIHAVDLMHAWFGGVSAVTARGRSITTKEGVYDAVSGLIELESGIDVTIVSTYCTQVLFEVRVAGTLGTLHFLPHSLWFRSTEDTDRAGRGPGKLHDFSGATPDAYTLQMMEFAEAVRNGGPIETSGEVGLKALAVVEAMNTSVEQSATVDLKELSTQVS